ncbi:class I SAM-dependent methyltransferase [Benzoatithermus flavus]|uniref:Class I SAM-dependent methyltransferase n=1 Tax=Benzoatithermus flavus TaxID=3108223 RepID=A0ABU8XV49_9PROT
MGFYTRVIVPRLIHRAMREEMLLPLRQRVLQGVAGRVLEIGVGSGLNLPLYGRGVTSLQAVDPSPYLLGLARRTAGWLPFPVILLEQSAEHLPLPDASIDTAVVTWALCSIPDPLAALREVRRVLAPGGQLRFLEHGLSSVPELARWQQRLTPLWRRLAGGCHLDRRIDRLLERAGFSIEQMETGHLLPGPRLLTFHYLGSARR